MSVVSASILIFLVLDPFGNIPLFLSVLEAVPRERRWRVVVRELFIALLILVAFLFGGPFLLVALHISTPTIHIAGGIILFLIALRMIFGTPQEMFRGAPDGEPLIVPLAVPCVAGPSAAATVLFLVGHEPQRWPEWLLSLSIAWFAAAVILVVSTRLGDLLGKRGLLAIQRLMGLILTAIAVEMLLQGIRAAFEI